MRHHDRKIFLIVKKNATQGKYSNVMESLRQSMTDMVSVVHEGSFESHTFIILSFLTSL